MFFYLFQIFTFFFCLKQEILFNTLEGTKRGCEVTGQLLYFVLSFLYNYEEIAQELREWILKLLSDCESSSYEALRPRNRLRMFV